jgi:glycosyltransferase involved in cell wall biosynthesis
MRRTVIFDWEVSSYTGWGVYGLNLALNWAGDPEVLPVCAYEPRPKALDLDAMSWLALQPFLRDSRNLAASLAAHTGKAAANGGPVLLGLDSAFIPIPPHDVQLTGKPTVGVVFAESAALTPDEVVRAKAYDLVIAGSSWNAALLRAHGIERVETILQGVDPTLFHPGPRRGVLGDRFVVFSGGKLERRKGQDLVVAAFRIFAQRHPDAILATAWHSPWADIARTLDISGAAAPVVFSPDGRIDVGGWAAANGIAPGQVLDLTLSPNSAMPRILREVDVAVFPNRGEGGTNLVAMEAMAAGAPVILSANTGHLDLIEGENCYALTRQGPLTGREGGVGDVPGWGESEVDEIVAALEAAYADREDARRRGLRGAETLARLTWAETARRLKTAILPLAGSG